MAIWQCVAALAALQHGVVARWQLRCLGLSDEVIEERLHHHGWRRLHRGVYALPGVPSSALRRSTAALLAYSRPTSGRERVEAALAADVPLTDALVRAAFGPWAVVGGAFAAFLHGLTAAEPATVHLVLPPGTSLQDQHGITLTYAVVAAGEIDNIGLLPVVTAERAVADVAAAVRPHKQAVVEVARLIATGDAKRITDVDRVAKVAADRGTFKGKPALDRAIAELRGTLSHSATEAWARRKVREIAARHGLTVHPRPYAIWLDGRRVAEADLAIVEIRYDLEIDGLHHLLPAQAEKDRRRDRNARSAGWAVDRFLVTEIEASRREFLAAVDAAIRARVAPKGR